MPFPLRSYFHSSSPSSSQPSNIHFRHTAPAILRNAIPIDHPIDIITCRGGPIIELRGTSRTNPSTRHSPNSTTEYLGIPECSNPSSYRYDNNKTTGLEKIRPLSFLQFYLSTTSGHNKGQRWRVGAKFRARSWVRVESIGCRSIGIENRVGDLTWSQKCTRGKLVGPLSVCQVAVPQFVSIHSFVQLVIPPEMRDNNGRTPANYYLNVPRSFVRFRSAPQNEIDTTTISQSVIAAATNPLFCYFSFIPSSSPVNTSK